MYLKSLIETVVGWAAGGAAGAIVALQAAGADLSAAHVWAGIGVAAGVGVIKGLAAKYAGPNANSSTLSS